MTVTLWIINILLAVAFLGAGFMKVAQPKQKLQDSGMNWVENTSEGAVKAIGSAEILGAVGLILPLALDIAPVLTPIAAVCLTIVMVGAVATHLRRSEAYSPALILGILSLVSAVIGFAVI